MNDPVVRVLLREVATRLAPAYAVLDDQVNAAKWTDIAFALSRPAAPPLMADA